MVGHDGMWLIIKKLKFAVTLRKDNFIGNNVFSLNKVFSAVVFLSEVLNCIINGGGPWQHFLSTVNLNFSRTMLIISKSSYMSLLSDRYFSLFKYSILFLVHV